jgi:hypothetical protein
MSWLSKDDKHFLSYSLKWMSIYIVIGLIAALIFPFPISLVAAIGGFMVVNFLRTCIMLKKMGISMKGLFDSMRASNANPSPSMYGYNPMPSYTEELLAAVYSLTMPFGSPRRPIGRLSAICISKPDYQSRNVHNVLRLRL